MPRKRGVRLLAKLSGEAFEKLENVDPDSLLAEDSVVRFKKLIEDAYEPVEDLRVGKIMDYFLEEFGRKRDQEISDYHQAWERELFKAEKVAGELAEKWKAHLYIKKMRLSATMRTQVLVGTLGQYTIAAFHKAAMSTFPNIKTAFGNAKSDGGGGHSGYQAGRGAPRGKPRSFGFPKSKFRVKVSHRAHETHLDEDGVEKQ